MLNASNSVHPSMHSSIYLSFSHASVHLTPPSLSIISIHPSMSLHHGSQSICVSVHHFIHAFIYSLMWHLFIYPFIHLSICHSISPSPCMYLSITKCIQLAVHTIHPFIKSLFHPSILNYHWYKVRIDNVSMCPYISPSTHQSIHQHWEDKIDGGL